MSNLYAIVCTDRPDSKPARMENLKQHLAHIEAVVDRLSLAAPLHDAENGFAGSLIIASAESEQDALAFIENDPYFKAGIWDRVDIRRVGTSAGAWVGGIPW